MLHVDLLQVVHQLHNLAVIKSSPHAVTSVIHAVAVMLADSGGHCRASPTQGIARTVVLPGHEPQQNEPHLVLAAPGLQQRIKKGEVELPLARLNLLPRQRVPVPC